MTKRTNCHFFFDEDTKEMVHIISAYLTKVKKNARAGKYGKDLFCPCCQIKQQFIILAGPLLHVIDVKEILKNMIGLLDLTLVNSLND